ncbi:MAG: hypothetical protein CFE30_02645 [Bradyrhizobium sp. PARBB1]|uniref:hypothetical protein n=2 Tax=Bradyrhizobium sp. TaxID=376 RepID=UPI00054D0C6A|nr:hypothetical protein [Bradyrhizobium sp.]OYU63874.1 MAG: hypothetical protein CFE30_02645 [Bradyrhizobium sp. PARBB1]PSO22363.1 hypothetical protein C7G43_26965 [Bradyrhizobium sp. MOS004]MCA3579508.1 hypothetical protein [Bradyrhizobium sp.]HAQ78972.1 hypothetical protein [Bradyrhizobium sp.]HAR18576.1 hypothetical protein [Bradyrhizobium sp.]
MAAALRIGRAIAGARPSWTFVMHAPKRAGLARNLATLLTGLCVASCAHDPSDRVTGECSVTLIGKCSSKQVTSDLSESDKAALVSLQNRKVGITINDALKAAEASLKANQFEQVSIDSSGALVQGEKNHKIADRGHQMLQAVINAKLPMLKGKPDHETTRALVTVHAVSGVTAVHAEFITTIWDSKGDSKTRVVTDPQVYNSFFAKFADNSPR